jgi:RNA 2',3'-cyclic 3'-phosphodiesterase
MNDAKHRIFVAIALPDPVLHEIIRAQRYFKKQELFEGTYPTPAVMHLTLKFVGEVREHDLAFVQRSLAAIRAKKIKLQLDAINFFGSPDFMKVIYVRLVGEGITELVHKIDQSLDDLVSPESQEYIPHVTLARIKQVYDLEALLESIELFSIDPIIFTVDSYMLMESELTQSGPIHAMIERYPLN